MTGDSVPIGIARTPDYGETEVSPNSCLYDGDRITALPMREATVSPPNADQTQTTTSTEPPSKANLAFLMMALCLAVFYQALDNTIIATAIPRITDGFDSLDDVGWYGAGYLYGKPYNLFPTKWVFLTALDIFELGSLVCGATPKFARIGSGGIFSGYLNKAILAIAASTPLEKRPVYNGLLGTMYAVGSIAGPLMGGVFTDHVTWRLSFYINLLFGPVTAACVLFFLPSRDRRKSGFSLPLKQKAKEFDFIGLILFIPFIVCLLLALRWGRSFCMYSWSNAGIIALFVVAGVLFMAFVAVQICLKEHATVPPNVIKQRTVWACSIYIFFLFGSFMAFIHYLPIWLQAIKGSSAVQSGIDTLPNILGTIVFSIVSGGLVVLFGYYTWTCVLPSILATVGLQQPLVAIQTILPDEQVDEGTAVIVFLENLGGAIFLAVAQNVFSNKLISNTIAERIPVNTAALLSTGATGIDELVEPQYLSQLS
ncbi:MFS general substrate transporter [Polychaeton citri CBS 116435]|uniref:MFS general substrate transporter n=1 Tax=Polychaeton citri CBS 116435 TaxID=1314669 RepID=A0A9P4Q0C7_9PEZI|nr:MFS general substrate transporter [Polychaeton citri CBS 116435]